MGRGVRGERAGEPRKLRAGQRVGDDQDPGVRPIRREAVEGEPDDVVAIPRDQAAALARRALEPGGVGEADGADLVRADGVRRRARAASATFGLMFSSR